MRRKKNADAQAAFRARRANYIASLEETGRLSPAFDVCTLLRGVAVTSLEAVVLSLQDTCREARNDADDLRHENARLLAAVDGMKQAARDREKQWRDFWHVKQQALGLDDSHLSDLPPPRLPATPPAGTELHTSNRSHYVDEGLRFQTNASGDADQRFPASLQPFTTNPEGNWIPGPFSNTRTPCVGDPHPSQSSEASDSPSSISPAVQYNTRFPLNADENRMSLVNLSMPSASYGTCMHVYVPFFFFFSNNFQIRDHFQCQNTRPKGMPTDMLFPNLTDTRPDHDARTRDPTRAAGTCMRQMCHV